MPHPNPPTTHLPGSANWVEKPARTRKKPPDSPDSAPCSNGAQPPIYSVFQAKLNWITLHSPAWMEGKTQAFVKWGNLSGRAAGEIYEKLNHDYIALEKALEAWPEEDLQGVRWLELRVRLQRWKGMLAGLWDVMQRNSRKGWVPLTPSGEPDG